MDQTADGERGTPRRWWPWEPRSASSRWDSDWVWRASAVPWSALGSPGRLGGLGATLAYVTAAGAELALAGRIERRTDHQEEAG
jgi:hypothetical protein